MKANKIFFDLYSTSGGTLPKEEYNKYYDEHDTVFICLMDAGIYTKVKRDEMFKRGMFHGCFIDSVCCRTGKEVIETATQFVNKHNLRFVEVDEFIKLEEVNNDVRVANAFATAECMIRND